MRQEENSKKFDERIPRRDDVAMPEGLRKANSMNPPNPRLKLGLAALWLVTMLPASMVILEPAFFPRAQAQQAEKGARMEGIWNCESATVNGKPLPEATVKQLRLTLTKTRYKTQKGDEVLFDSDYVLDAAQNPAHIDIVGTEGDLKGRKAQGIYALSGDTLKICYTMPGKARPAAFESPPGSEAHYVIWKRQK